ncbi:hypothetical protein VE01_08257 [Pseudogymnoascus verrucosus]|uniref:UspA domain-containing protein n=1 Tax=Pseudogymnoascus verrucosus TaxID=342668 RepID=A0A1B8GDM5_9PEZI|nr:uncharacterized protein VE01_08257 [Pseudogymnoascus verrucosus]OBT93923.2 hypothetical protein VE01_08257 [Pseudogymnoascus verrucosus]
MAGRPTMSMEAALDEERLDVLELLQGLSNKPARAPRGPGSPMGPGPAPLGRSSSPYNAHRSPVRSMLDVVEDPRPRHSSIAGTSSSGVTPIRSMLDIGPPAPQISKSASTSPTDSFSSLTLPPKGLAEIPPHQPQGRYKGDVTDSYQFSGYLQSNPGAPLAPRRNTLAGKKAAPAPLAEGVRVDLPYSARDRVHAMGTTGIGSSNKSRSPHNRHSLRSSSPSLGPPPTSNMLVMDSGAVVDKDSAYRRLSDANLARAGGSFSAFTNKVRRRTDSNDKRDQRLQKDYTFTGAEDAVESSDEASTDEDGPRGRRSEKKRLSKGDDHPESKTIGMGRAQGQRTARSLMAAAEEERQMIEDKQQYKVRSLLEPEITITGPGGDRLKGAAKPGVHPTNAFDHEGGSGLNTPHDSDTEQEISDIRRAQRLAINLTPITSTPETQRSVRTLFRGDFNQMQKEAEEHQRRVRKYLVATDLSEEAAHALEWTVGTVLRDGDTLLAIYCVDEETGVIPDTNIGSTDTATMEKQAASIASATHAIPPSISSFSTMSSHSHIPSPLGTPRTGVSASPMSRDRPRTEQERHRAVENITERVSKLLRKTKLQVRVVIEVIHCKSPKHLICEVIDYFNPTLVILGSRGRSALKGVILGSFSNYLVTKSSVPVMVARKRLRKHTKYKRSHVRLANNLTGVSGKTLASAKID